MNAELRAALDRIRSGFSLSAVADRAGVKLQRAGNEWKACCPFHADRTPSFTIYSGDRRFMCFGCGAEGDVLDFMRRAYRVGLVDAVRMLDSGALGAIEAPAATERPRKDLSGLVARIWGDAAPIAGTPAARYLRNRGIDMDMPDCLRFTRLAPPTIEGNGLLAANGPGPLPVLLALVTGPDGGHPALQRTYLAEDGRKAAVVATEQDRKPKVKYSLGNVRGGAIRLGPASGSIVVTEGLEDGATIAQALGRSVWVAAGTSMLSHMQFPDGVRAVVIGADGDEPGRVAAEKAATAYVERGLSVRITPPPPPHKDWNDWLQAQRSGVPV
ncbi:CHC2 zinc finger domain-containing protein [uncultured Sphingomonas sp.]|uniref:DUF7146 domain-containing protein n=1 Tax=uncultured Sphingomonas sp. TaxID=158754 RepID=UPI0025E7C6C3|nr:CHC2 zinc finger domain-containing protein [uncultured Sphingomonas sp.]